MKCPQCKIDNPDDSQFCRKCGASLTAIPATLTSPPPEKEGALEKSALDFAPGQYFGNRYQIIEEIGRGGMGRVYKALDKELNRTVALKMIKPEISSHPGIVQRFKKEIKLASQITHENVCRIHDLGEVEGIKYISMQFIEGQNLHEFIQASKILRVGTAINITEQICQALNAAHKKSVIHRDLKPQNIMIDKKGNAYVMDFGIARSLEAEEVTKPGAVIGTPHYMSPEQAEGKKADARSDIYSLGCIMYEMLTGKPPFEADTSVVLIHKHLKEKPQSPLKLNPQVSPALEKIILKCLEKEQEKRFQKADEIIKGLQEAVIEAMPAAKPLKLSRKLIIAFSAILVVLIGLVIFFAIRKMKPEPPSIIAPGKKSIAVMYFENNTGDESLDHWRKGLSDLLIADLTQSKYLRVLSGDRLFKILEQLNQLEKETYSSDVLEKVAAQGRVEHILLGKYAKAGDTFRINIMLQEASTGELLGSEGVEGKGEESIFSMVDELTRRIKANFEFSYEQIASDIDRDVGKITTSSPEAYKYHIEAAQYFIKGDYRKSIQFWEKALAIDPEFASAYHSIAITYFNMGYTSEGKKYSQKAFELADRVSDRERYLIQGGFYLQTEETYDKAIEAYTKLLRIYTDDIFGNGNLGFVYKQLEEWDKAIELCEVLIQNKTNFPQVYCNQANAFSAKGQCEKARKVLEYYLNNVLDSSYVHIFLSENYLFQGKYDLALIEADKALSIEPTNYQNSWIKGDVYHLKGDLIKAEKEYLELLEAGEQIAHIIGRVSLSDLYLLQGKFEESKIHAKQGIELGKKLGEKLWESNFHLKLAYLYLKSGNLEVALEECNKAWNSAIEAEDLRMQRYALYSKGLIYLTMKSMANVQKTANELKELIEQGMNRKAERLYYHLMGMLELKRNNFYKAVEYFKKALMLLSSHYSRGTSIKEFTTRDNHAVFIDALASAYYQAGNIEKAREEYEKIISLTSGRLLYGDIYAKSYYMLGKIYQQKGWEGKAIEHYEKFLNLWKDADPGIPEIAEAKKQLAVLQSK